MQEILFIFFALLTLLASVMVVTSRHAVNGVMFMIVAFLGTAGIFFLLEAYMLMALQIVVYAGAVMVLFLFVIMLMDVEHPTTFRFGPSLVLALVAFSLLLVVFVPVLTSGMDLPAPELRQALDFPVVEDGSLAYADTAKALGFGLLTKYMLPFQVAGLLLLVAMIGVIVLSKRHSPTKGNEPAGMPPSVD